MEYIKLKELYINSINYFIYLDHIGIKISTYNNNYYNTTNIRA